MTNCGATSESCCTSLEVTGGTFYRAYLNNGSGPTDLAALATVSSFRLDKYDVTVGRFRQFVSAWNGGSGWLPPMGSGKHIHLNGGQGLTNSASAGTYETGWLASDDSNVSPTNEYLGCDPAWDTWTDSPGGHENLPIICVNWWESYAFCIWDGGFLPSEAEWEYAAAGGSQQREYPWGSAAPGTGNQYAIYDCYYDPPGCSGVSSIAPVGTPVLGAGAWGQLDLAGNVWEWTLDWADYPWFMNYQGSCTDCAYLTAPLPQSERVFRGGDYLNSAQNMQSSLRSEGDPAERDDQGFRCARTP